MVVSGTESGIIMYCTGCSGTTVGCPATALPWYGQEWGSRVRVLRQVVGDVISGVYNLCCLGLLVRGEHHAHSAT